MQTEIMTRLKIKDEILDVSAQSLELLLGTCYELNSLGTKNIAMST